MRQNDRQGSSQRNIVRIQQPRKGVAGEIRILALALPGERIEAGQDVVDETRVAHDNAALGKTLEKLLHQTGKIGSARKIIGAGECRIECNIRARGAATELRTQQLDYQRLGSKKAPMQRPMASALPHPGGGCGLLHGREKTLADLRKQLNVLMAIDEIRRAA